MLLRRCSMLLAIALPLVGARIAFAQPTLVGEGAEPAKAFTVGHPFVELDGDWGFQFGTQSYVPNGTLGASKQPLTNGFGGGVTAGFAITNDIELLFDFAHGDASSRTGAVTGALTAVDGNIAYDTIVGGARMARLLGPGRMYGQLGAGISMPFATTVTYQYASTLAPYGIMGTGTERENYGYGVGAIAEFGYHLPVVQGVYLGASLRLQEFQMSNDGYTTQLDNFVTDFGAPQAVTGDVHHGTTMAATPTNYSVQDARVHLAIGYDF
jgi:hypothetical protein